MLFNSLTFLCFFFLLLAAYNIIRSWPGRKLLLLIASYLFYAAWNPPFVLLLWISTAVDWIIARKIADTGHVIRRRWLLGISILVNLGLLGFFKYGNFFLENFTAFVKLFGITYQAARADIILPVGISFYTFQTMSYTLDVYLRRAKPAASLLDFSLYVTFFPQLVAGPIVRATDFLPQCAAASRVTGRQFGWGLYLVSLGLFQKVVLADGLLSKAAETVFGVTDPLYWLDAWLGVLAFSGQIFCDFAGYSTCAIGVALCFGFYLPDNFRFPYAAIGFSDFWRRWHISLSTWLRDYLYIPLGGNRTGRVRTYVHLMITMLLGGLWHGAAWTFVAWGGLHGLYLAVERFLKSRFGRARWVRHICAQLAFAVITYGLILLTWVFFRAADFAGAMNILRSMLCVNGEGAQVLRTLDIYKVILVTVGINTSHWLMRNSSLESVLQKIPAGAIALWWSFMVVTVILMQGGSNAFIYFQF